VQANPKIPATTNKRRLGLLIVMNQPYHGATF
jgi:hypothetical protein